MSRVHRVESVEELEHHLQRMYRRASERGFIYGLVTGLVAAAFAWWVL